MCGLRLVLNVSVRYAGLNEQHASVHAQNENGHDHGYDHGYVSAPSKKFSDTFTVINSRHT